MSTAKIVGVYPVSEAEDPCHLVEIAVTDGNGMFDLADITQEVVDQPRENWQVPFAERIVSADGTSILTDEFEAEDFPDLWIGDYRIAFFFHFLDLNSQLATPFGLLTLPAATNIPARLSQIVYEAP